MKLYIQVVDFYTNLAQWSNFGCQPSNQFPISLFGWKRIFNLLEAIMPFSNVFRTADITCLFFKQVFLSQTLCEFAHWNPRSVLWRKLFFWGGGGIILCSSALSRRYKSAVRYTNVNGIVVGQRPLPQSEFEFCTKLKVTPRSSCTSESYISVDTNMYLYK